MKLSTSTWKISLSGSLRRIPLVWCQFWRTVRVNWSMSLPSPVSTWMKRIQGRSCCQRTPMRKHAKRWSLSYFLRCVYKKCQLLFEKTFVVFFKTVSVVIYGSLTWERKTKQDYTHLPWCVQQGLSSLVPLYLSKVIPLHSSPDMLHSSHTECFQSSQTHHLINSCWQTLPTSHFAWFSPNPLSCICSDAAAFQELVQSGWVPSSGFPHAWTLPCWGLPAFLRVLHQGVTVDTLPRYVTSPATFNLFNLLTYVLLVSVSQVIICKINIIVPSS